MTKILLSISEQEYKSYLKLVRRTYSIFIIAIVISIFLIVDTIIIIINCLKEPDLIPLILKFNEVNLIRNGLFFTLLAVYFIHRFILLPLKSINQNYTAFKEHFEDIEISFNNEMIEYSKKNIKHQVQWNYIKETLINKKVFIMISRDNLEIVIPIKDITQELKHAIKYNLLKEL